MHTTLSRLALRSGAVATATLFAVGIGLAPASAHVRVKPDATASGGYAGLTFRVPNESDTASTTKIVLTLPQDRPLANVSIRPVPGWTATVVEADLPKPNTNKGATLTRAPHIVTWTASTPGAAIAPGQYQEFAISAGPLPSPGLLLLPVAQSYSDGTVVNWDQPQESGKEEPEHPAPQFVVTAADFSATPAAAVATGTVGPDSDGSDVLARSLAGAALVVGLLAIGAQFIGSRRRRATAAA
jgi:uncharacterized protein YcnI